MGCATAKKAVRPSGLSGNRVVLMGVTIRQSKTPIPEIIIPDRGSENTCRRQIDVVITYSQTPFF